MNNKNVDEILEKYAESFVGDKKSELKKLYEKQEKASRSYMYYFKVATVACCIFLMCAVTVTIILHQYNLRFMGSINSSSGANNGNSGENISDNGSEEDNTVTEAPMFTVEAVGELSAEKKAEIEKAWLDYANNNHMDEIEREFEWCQQDDHYLKARYYGTFDEGVVFFKETTGQFPAGEESGSWSDYGFRNPKRFNIYIYKNGEILKINSQSEYLDEEDIEEIWNAHKEYQKYLYPEYYEEYYSNDSGILNP